MAKPILAIRLRTESVEYIKQIYDVVESQIKDYHVLVYVHAEEVDISIQVFYEKDFDDVKYEDLKQIITDASQSYLSKENDPTN